MTFRSSAPAPGIRLFDETVAGMRFDVAGEALSLEKALNLLSDTDRAMQRQAAAEAVAEGFQEKIGLFTLVTNTLAKEKEIEDRWRQFETPQAARHLVESGGGRGGPGAARRGRRRLSAHLAPLLRAESEVARPRDAAPLGPQRAAAR